MSRFQAGYALAYVVRGRGGRIAECPRQAVVLSTNFYACEP